MHRKKIRFGSFVLLLCMLVAACGSPTAPVQVQKISEPYCVQVTNGFIPEGALLAPGQTVWDFLVTNCGTSSLKSLIARGFYGDSGIGPKALLLPDLNPGETKDIGIPINILPPTQSKFKLVYGLLRPNVDGENTGTPVYVLIQGTVLVIKYSGAGTSLPTNTHNYILLKPVTAPDTSPFCANDPGDGNFFDGQNTLAVGKTVQKKWVLSSCSKKGGDWRGFVAVAFYGDLSAGPAIIPVPDLRSPFDYTRYYQNTVIVTADITPKQSGDLLLVYILARPISFKSLIYYEPIPPVFWIYDPVS